MPHKVFVEAKLYLSQLKKVSALLLHVLIGCAEDALNLRSFSSEFLCETDAKKYLLAGFKKETKKHTSVALSHVSLYVTCATLPLLGAVSQFDYFTKRQIRVETKVEL